MDSSYIGGEKMANFVTFEQMQVIAGSIGNNFTTINNIIDDTQDTITDSFSELKNYNIGDLVVYNNTLYKCKSPHSAGEWASSDFEETNLSELINEAKDYSEDKNKPQINGVTLDGNKSSQELGISLTGSYKNENLYIH